MIGNGSIDYGKRLDNRRIKNGLRKLNADIHFDVGGKTNKFHPSIDKMEGVFHKGKHITSLERGPSVPEFNVMQGMTVGEEPFYQKVWVPRNVGWRHTFKRLVDSNIPGITWDTLCAEFAVERKYFMGMPSGIYEVA